MVAYEGKGKILKSVTLDDVRVLLPTDVAILMKIDIEGSEEKAMSQAGPFLHRSFVPFIMMEWAFQKNNTNLLNMMENYRYYPVCHRTGKKLEEPNDQWHTDIIWVHERARIPDNLHIVSNMY